jgi:hypothetical protein
MRPQTTAKSAFPQVEGAHGNHLRSRVRRFESCWRRFFENPIEQCLLARNALTCENANKIKSLLLYARSDNGHGIRLLGASFRVAAGTTRLCGRAGRRPSGAMAPAGPVSVPR